MFVSLFHLYAAYDIVPAHVLRPAHVGMVLVLCFLLFPMARRFRDRIRWWDYLFAAASAATIGYVLSQGAYFGDRATMPTTTDYYVGVVFIVLLLEGTRRATGWIMPGVAIAFLLYAIYGKYLPPPWTHRGYPLDDLVAHLYMTLEGIFGTTVDVASSLIILFTIFGAVLQSRALAVSSSISRSPPWAAGATRPAAPWCCRPSCWEGRRARGSPPPSPSARSRTRCSPRPATTRTPPAGCSLRAASAPSSRRRCSVPPPS